MIITDPNAIRKIAQNARNVALVGISNNPERDSYHIAQQIIQRYQLFFVNPVYDGESIMGKQVRSSLKEINQIVDIVDVFRNPQFIEPIINEAIETNAKVIWFQPGSENIEIIEKYKDFIDIIYNSCLGVVSKMK